MSDVLTVRLHGQDVGEIVRFRNGRIRFEFLPEYASRRDRPTLSRSFLDEYGNVTGTGKHTISGEVPVFFSNLLPEGRLRTYLAAKAGVRETREFELLGFLGRDLPGAVVVVPPDGRDHRSPPATPIGGSDSPPDVLRFSLAGVQLKFSAVEKAAGGLTVPARGIGGDWILKLPSVHHDAIPENEYSMMSLAGMVGIEVPEARLVPMSRIEGLPPEVADGRMAGANALATRRYDRTEEGRVHAEDFAQVFGLWPGNKYDQYSYANIATVLALFSGNQGDVGEFSRRLMYAALVGNGDLHMKNWSLIYRDGRTAELSPAYDLLCTAPYIPGDDMALKLGATRRWRDLTLDDFAAVADRAHADPDAFVNAAAETAERFGDIWQDASKSLPVPGTVKSAIEGQRATVPAITGTPRRRTRRTRT
ncbi:MAG: HipA domain-containing protein [Gammaproteobacteria bacterium]|nr:HipA domain-containing protein [Gammaproteobacteria bacterium]